jgi:hypothetical protein
MRRDRWISHLDEILGDNPNFAKRRLQEAGLNYFLFMKDYRVIDFLPYSRLFAPDTIGGLSRHQMERRFD